MMVSKGPLFRSNDITYQILTPDDASDDQKLGNGTSIPAADKGFITAGAVRRALHKKMRNYRGGIEGVWKAVDPQFKNENKPNPNDIKGMKRKGKIGHSAFIGQAIRFAKAKEPANEQITFTVKTSTLLLLNVFEILGIKSIDDLVGMPFQEENIDAVNRETNINSKRILRRLSKMNERLMTFDSRKKRFPIQKVCFDLEDIVIKLHDMLWINEDIIIYPEIHNIIELILPLNPKQHRFVFNSHVLLNEYRMYASRDVLLHKYSDFIVSADFTSYEKGNKLFFLSPLYILYFFITVNKYFLIGLASKRLDQKSASITPLFDNFNMSINEKMNNLMNKKSVNENILVLNNDIHKCLRSILSLTKNMNIIISYEKYEEYYSILKETIKLYYSLYEEETVIISDWTDYLIKNIKNLNDIYFFISLGRGIKFIPLKNDIEKLIEIKIKLGVINDELTRELTHIYG